MTVLSCGNGNYAVAKSTTMKEITKTLILLSLVLAGCGAWASELSTACGDDAVQYTVSTKAKAPLPATNAEHARLVFIESVRELCGDCTDVIARTAVDGSWVGANAGNSYFISEVAPGAHQVCADWQRPVISRRGTLAFKAEAGRTYYFLVNISKSSKNLEAVGPANERFTIQQIAEPKARELLAEREVSIPEVYH